MVVFAPEVATKKKTLLFGGAKDRGARFWLWGIKPDNHSRGAGDIIQNFDTCILDAIAPTGSKST